MKYDYPNLIISFKMDLTITPSSGEDEMRDYIYSEISGMVSRGEANLHLEEHSRPKTLLDVAEAVCFMDDIDESKWDGWFTYCNQFLKSNEEPDVAQFLEIYQGEYDDLADFLRANCDQFVKVTKEQMRWIDFDIVAEDYTDTFSEIDGHIYSIV